MTLAAGETLRIGCVQYLNSRPLIYGWPGPVDFDTPSALSRKLDAGQLDVAFVSSFEFLTHPVYTIVDDVAVACDGPVYSVILVHREPLEAIAEIELDPSSGTSVNLLRCLLAETGLTPRMIAPSAADSLPPQRARLLIGDQAIRFRQRHREAYQYRDLGQWWKELTGLPFVFALWLIRPEVADAPGIARRLRLQRNANFADIEQIIVREKEFDPDFCRRYFRDFLRFRLGEHEKQGLYKFRQLCHRHGVLASDAGALRLA